MQRGGIKMHYQRFLAAIAGLLLPAASTGCYYWPLFVPVVGRALVVSFSPVGLIWPARLALVLPDASLLVASALPLDEPELAPVELPVPEVDPVEPLDFELAEPPDLELPEPPEVLSAPLPVAELLAGGRALVVSFSPVGLILPSRFAWVLPAAFLVVASGLSLLLEPELMLLLFPVVPLPDALLPVVPVVPLAPLVEDEVSEVFGRALVVSFSPVGLIWPARLALVLPDASLLVASAAPLDCAWTDAAPNIIANAATLIIRLNNLLLVMLVLLWFVFTMPPEYAATYDMTNAMVVPDAQYCFWLQGMA
jgi:hypothetical protein